MANDPNRDLLPVKETSERINKGKGIVGACVVKNVDADFAQQKLLH